MEISLRQLKRILDKRGLSQRQNQSSPEEDYKALRTELSGRGSINGYRSMHQRLRNCHKLMISQDTVRKALKFWIQLELKHALGIAWEGAYMCVKALITRGT